MSYIGHELPLYNDIDAVTAFLKQADNRIPEYTRHYNQSEEFFITLQHSIEIPGMPYHHDVASMQPDHDLAQRLVSAVSNCISSLPGLFCGLQHFFMPTEPHKPAFYRVHKIDNRCFLYLLKLDFSYRPMIHSPLESSGNDYSPAYTTNRLHLEADLIPLQEVKAGVLGLTAVPDQVVSDTWIGEMGRGYFLHGIWIDSDLTKFFTKLLLKRNSHTYPYYPITCKYQSITGSIIDLSNKIDTQLLPTFRLITDFIKRNIATIQSTVREHKFTDELIEFRELYDQIPESWRSLWANIEIITYLNDQNQKEYLIRDNA